LRLRGDLGVVTISAPPPSETTQQSQRCSGSEIIGEFDHLLDGDHLAQHGVRVPLGVVRRPPP
jgi:hypothetical protein